MLLALNAGGANEVLNERAVAVMKRMSDKLTGRDFLQVIALARPCLGYRCVFHLGRAFKSF